jgi:hypothetical protein
MYFSENECNDAIGNINHNYGRICRKADIATFFDGQGGSWKVVELYVYQGGRNF